MVRTRLVSLLVVRLLVDRSSQYTGVVTATQSILQCQRHFVVDFLSAHPVSVSSPMIWADSRLQLLLMYIRDGVHSVCCLHTAVCMDLLLTVCLGLMIRMVIQRHVMYFVTTLY